MYKIVYKDFCTLATDLSVAVFRPWILNSYWLAGNICTNQIVAVISWPVVAQRLHKQLTQACGLSINFKQIEVSCIFY